MREDKIFREFGKPFPACDVSWRFQYLNEEKLSGKVVPFLDARAIANRLDEVVGPYRWKDSYISWHECVMNKKQKTSQLCVISIYDEELGQWIDKTDGAEDSDIEPIKGGLSDAFKRAAVKWNIGRYLYRFDPVWVDAEKQGNSHVIAKHEKDRLAKIYNDVVSRMFKSDSAEPKQMEKADRIYQKDPADTAIYEIKKIKVEQSEKGMRSSMTLEGMGKTYQAFLNGNDERLKTGTKLVNLKVQQRENSYGSYVILDAYDVAA